jgi:hypothetical protein
MGSIAGLAGPKTGVPKGAANYHPDRGDTSPARPGLPPTGPAPGPAAPHLRKTLPALG